MPFSCSLSPCLYHHYRNYFPFISPSMVTQNKINVLFWINICVGEPFKEFTQVKIKPLRLLLFAAKFFKQFNLKKEVFNCVMNVPHLSVLTGHKFLSISKSSSSACQVPTPLKKKQKQT